MKARLLSKKCLIGRVFCFQPVEPGVLSENFNHRSRGGIRNPAGNARQISFSLSEACSRQ